MVVVRTRSRGLWPRSLFLPALLTLLCGCYDLEPSTGGGENVSFSGTRNVKTSDVIVPPGYEVSIVAMGLSFPTGICFDAHGAPYVTESGGNGRQPHLLGIKNDGSTVVVASGTDAPWNGVAFHDGNFYVAASGSILKITPDGQTTPLVQNLPSRGDYHTTGPLIGSDGQIYFAQGTATNSGIVGQDNQAWEQQNRQFHDVPGVDITLAGLNAQTPDGSVTGAYSPYGEPTAKGQTIEGQVPCSGAVMRIPITGGDAQLLAWGFRNPFGLAFAPSGQLYVTDQSYEERGSRPVSGCGDLLWAVVPDRWYGWPDYWADQPLSGSRQFAPVGKSRPQPVLAKDPNEPPKPWAIFGMHAGAAGMDFCTSQTFGHRGEVFVAEFGDLSPLAGKVLAPVGFDVLRVDPVSGVSHVFFANRSDATGPASKLGTQGLERPIAVRFDPSGNSLYVVDYGVMTVDDQVHPQPATGVIWKITRKKGA